MVRATKQSTVAAVDELADWIDEAVALQQQLEDIKTKLDARKAAIKECMGLAGLERHATAAKNEAVLIGETRLTWNVDKLERVLDSDQFDTLCPRKPNGEQLRKLLDTATGTEARSLKACAKEAHAQRLELRAPAA